MKQNCHAELADLRTVERSENRIASRLSLLEQSSLGETLRAWSKSKTVSGTIRHCFLPVSLARFRNKFGMTRAEPVLELNQSEKSTKESTVHCPRAGISPWRSTGGQAGLLFGWSLKSHVQPVEDATQRSGLPRGLRPLAKTVVGWCLPVSPWLRYSYP